MISLTKNVYKQKKRDLPLKYRFLNRKEVMDLLHISKSTLYRWEKTLNLPKHKIGNSRKILYKYDELLEWMGVDKNDEFELNVVK